MQRNRWFFLALVTLAGCAQAPRPPAGDGTHSAAARVLVMSPTPPIAAASDIEDDAGDAEAPIRMTVSTSGEIDCAGRELNIVGRDADLVLHGHCPSVSLFGGNGSLQIEPADALRILGDHAQVRMRGDAGRVVLFGRHGKLQMARIATLEASGDRNQLDASEIGSIALQGSSNAMVQHRGTVNVDDAGHGNRILQESV